MSNFISCILLSVWFKFSHYFPVLLTAKLRMRKNRTWSVWCRVHEAAGWNHCGLYKRNAYGVSEDAVVSVLCIFSRSLTWDLTGVLCPSLSTAPALLEKYSFHAGWIHYRLLKVFMIGLSKGKPTIWKEVFCLSGFIWLFLEHYMLHILLQTDLASQIKLHKYLSSSSWMLCLYLH